MKILIVLTILVCFQTLLASRLDVADVAIEPSSCIGKISTIEQLATDKNWTLLAGIFRICKPSSEHVYRFDAMENIGAAILGADQSDERARLIAWKWFVRTTAKRDSTFWSKIFQLIPTNITDKGAVKLYFRYLVWAALLLPDEQSLPTFLANNADILNQPIPLAWEGMRYLFTNVQGDTFEKAYERLLDNNVRITDLEGEAVLGSLGELRPILINALLSGEVPISKVRKYYQSQFVSMRVIKKGFAASSDFRQIWMEKAKHIDNISLHIPPSWNNTKEISKLVYFLAEKSADLEELKEDLGFLTLHHRKEACMVYKDAEVKERLALLENMNLDREPLFTLVKNMLRSCCIGDKTVAVPVVTPTTLLRVFGNSEGSKHLRLPEFVDGDDLTNEKIMQSDIKTLKTYVLAKDQFAKLFTYVSEFLDHEEFVANSKYIGQIKGLYVNNAQAFDESTRSGAFRDLARKISLKDGKNFQSFCSISTNSCKDILEQSLHDLRFTEDPIKGLDKWNGDCNNIARWTKPSSCKQESVADCKNVIVAPKITEIFAALKESDESKKPKIMERIDAWMPSEYFKPTIDLDIFDAYLKYMFLSNGKVGRFKLALANAPRAGAETEGFMHAFWYVLHFLDSPDPIKYLDSEIKRHPNGPTFADICGKERCKINISTARPITSDLSRLQSDFLLKRKLDHSLYTMAPHQEFGELEKPKESDAISDKFMYFILEQYQKTKKEGPRQMFLGYIFKYVRILARQLEFTNPQRVIGNFFFILDQPDQTP